MRFLLSQMDEDEDLVPCPAKPTTDASPHGEVVVTICAYVSPLHNVPDSNDRTQRLSCWSGSVDGKEASSSRLRVGA